MKPAIIRVLYWRELRHFLRDRRTVFSLILAPVLMSCLLLSGIGFFLSRSLHDARAHGIRLSMASGFPGGIQSGLRRFERLPGFSVSVSPAPVDDVREGRADAALTAGDTAGEIVIHGDFAAPDGAIRGKRIADALDALRDSLIGAKLDALHLPRSILAPFTTRTVPVSKQRSNAMMVLAPFLLLQFLIAGSIYPALDLTAGERERRTAELSLTAPVSSAERVLAKFLTIVTSATVSSAAALLTFFLTLRLFVARMEGPFARLGQIAGDPATWAIAGLVSIPLIALLAACALALAAAARSSQEASSYLSPMTMIALVLAMTSFIPGAKWTLAVSLVPIANWVMLTHDLFSGAFPWTGIAACAAANLAFAALALRIAVARFGNESVLFRS